METFSGLSSLERSAGDEALAALYEAAEAEKESKDSTNNDPDPDEHVLDPAAK